MKTFAIAAASIGLVFSATPALAGPAELPRQSVSLAGIDLNTPEGQRMLDQRIDRAARAVCQLDQAPTGTRIQSRSARACFANARVSAQRQTAAIIASRRSGG